MIHLLLRPSVRSNAYLHLKQLTDNGYLALRDWLPPPPGASGKGQTGVWSLGPKGRTLLVSFDTDWLFPVSEVERVEAAMIANGTPVQHERISSPNGHDTFLIDYNLITDPVRAFLSS